MADNLPTKPAASAEKAYADAAGSVPTKPAIPAASSGSVAFPGREQRAAKPVATGAKAASAPVKPASVPAPAPAKVPPVAEPRLAPKAAASKPVPVKSAPAKAVAAKPSVVAKPVAAKPAVTLPDVAPVPAVAAAALAPVLPAAALAASLPVTSVSSQPKEKPMDQSPDFVANMQKVVSESQAKAKQVFDKGTAAFGEATEFAKGNVDAMVQSGKILAAGLQDMGSVFVTESKSAFETLTSDAKELSAARSPSDFLKLQSDIARRNFDQAIVLGSRNSEAFFKLANDVFAPLSSRVNAAVDKVRPVA